MKFRYSMIDSYLACPNKFRAGYLLDGPRETSDALEFGTALHLAFKTHFEEGDPYAVFEMFWNSVKAKNLSYGRFSWEDLGGMVRDTFLPNFIKLHSKKFTEVKLEETAEMPFLGSNSLSGTFDVACMYEGKLSIVDYKTSAREYHMDKITRNPQMYIYAKLYETKYGVLPEQLVYKVFIKQERRIQTLKINLTKEKLDIIMSNVESVCKDMLQRIESNNWYCNYHSPFCSAANGCIK